MILCFLIQNDIFSALIVQYFCRHVWFALSESPAMFKLVVVPGTFPDTKTVSKRKNAIYEPSFNCQQQAGKPRKQLIN